MATTQRQFPGLPVTGANATSQAIDSSTTGIKLTYTCPAGRQAIVRLFWMSNVVAGPTVALQGSPNGQTRTLATFTAATLQSPGYFLDSGETLKFNVTAASPATTFDAGISVEEYLAQ